MFAAGVAGATLVLRSAPDGVTWTTITSVTIDALGLRDSGWVSLPAASQTGVYLAAWGQGGDGVTDPGFSVIAAQAK